MSPDYASVVATVQGCRRCPRMEGRRRVLGPANGPLEARAVIVGLAPGRLGGDRTGVPFTADRSGMMLDHLLGVAGLRRQEVFITNAVLCNPRDASGRNATPSVAERRNCRSHLGDTLACVRAPLLVAVGRVAHESLWSLSGRPTPAFAASLGVVAVWTASDDQRLSITTYHCGPKVTAHPARRAALLRQWQMVGEVVRALAVSSRPAEGHRRPPDGAGSRPPGRSPRAARPRR